jgi:hypothetical protein
MQDELTQRIFDSMRVNGTVTSIEVAAQATRQGVDKPTRTDFVRRVAVALGDMDSKGKGRETRSRASDAMETKAARDLEFRITSSLPANPIHRNM